MVTDPYMHNAFSFSDSDPKYSAFCYTFNHLQNPASELWFQNSQHPSLGKSKFVQELLLAKPSRQNSRAAVILPPCDSGILGVGFCPNSQKEQKILLQNSEGLTKLWESAPGVTL